MCKQVLCPLGAYINGLGDKTLFVHLTEKLLQIECVHRVVKGICDLSSSYQKIKLCEASNSVSSHWRH